MRAWAFWPLPPFRLTTPSSVSCQRRSINTENNASNLNKIQTQLFKLKMCFSVRSPLHLSFPSCLTWIQLIRAQSFHCDSACFMESNILSPKRTPVVFHLQSNSVLCVILEPWKWCISFRGPGYWLACSLSIYGQASQHFHILCWNRKEPNCRPLQICMQTDRAKYIRGRAALLHPEGTRFFPFAILCV